MATGSRSAQFSRLHKILKKHYRPVASDPRRPVLEHLVFACCLENAPYDAAEEAFAALVHTFFDWNEVRVTSLAELSEVLHRLPDPRAAAGRIKRVLHSVFEAAYSFDLEERRKKNLGPTIKWLEKLHGTTKFTVAYVVQAALGGHAIPVDPATMAALRVVDLVSNEDAAAGIVPGMERAIPKAKGTEFGSLLHQLGADFAANPYAPAIRQTLLEINPDAQERLPKRRAKKQAKPSGQAKRPKEPPPAADASAAGPADAAGARKRGPRAAQQQSEKLAADGSVGPAPPAKRRRKTSGKTPSEPKGEPVAEGADPPPGSSRARSSSEGISKRKPR
jgi:endonuclease III